MALFRTEFATRKRQMPTPQGGEVLSVHLSILLSALATNDVIEFGPLPAGCVPVDAMVVADDIDSNGSPTVSLDVGILNAGKTAVSTASADGGAAWISGSNIGQAGGIVRPTTKAIGRVAVSALDRNLGALAATGCATFTASNGGTVTLVLSYRNAQYSA